MEQEPPEPRTLDELEAVVARLRAPDGCSWDRVQTLTSMRGSLIEELYEFIDALDQRDPAGFREELGDLYFLLVFYGQLGREAGWGERDAVLGAVCRKLVSRHPHVFERKPGEPPIDEAEVLRRWEERKKREKAANPDPSILSGIPHSLPSLQGVMQILEKTGHVGFPGIPEDEEPAPITDEAELGRELFRLIQRAKKGGLDADKALRGQTQAFRKRFGRMEARIKEQGGELSKQTRDSWKDLWESVGP